MTTITPSDTPQNRAAWGWNSINSFVETTKQKVLVVGENTKTVSESFFDNVTATLSKKDNEPQHTHPSSISNANKSELEEWKSKYNQLKHAHTLKTAMLENELQKYKNKHLSFNRHISLQTESKIAKLESQITKHKHNEKECIHIFTQNIRKYHQNIDELQHKMDNKYKIFYEKLFNITLKSGLNPKDIFNDNHDTVSVVSDFEEKEHIYNAEECITEQHNIKTNEYKMNEEKHEQQIVELKCKLKECQVSLDQFRNKFLDLVEKNDELKEENNTLNIDFMKKKEEYKELETLFESMSDGNTEFQQQICDVKGENALLRAQLNEYKAQNQNEMDKLMMENSKLSESLNANELKYKQVSAKLSNEYGMSDQLRDQIKEISKRLHKKNKCCMKQKKKMDALGKEREQLQYINNEQRNKLTKYNCKIAELEAEQKKYNHAISMYKSLQNEIEEYIDDNHELKEKISDLENELMVIKEHGNELRKQSKRDTKNISRLTDCNDELVEIIKQCEDILMRRAHEYLAISVINVQELELTDSDDDYKEAIITNDNEKNTKNIIYFNESDSDLCEKDEDDIYLVSKEQDIKALQSGARLKIQISMLSEELEKLHNEMNTFKRKLHRAEEENMRQQHELRQIAMRKRLQASVRKELGMRENNMVSIASVRGVNMRHNTSLANLTKTQDKVNNIINNMEHNDKWFIRNISSQLSGNTKSKAMRVSQSPLSTCSLRFEDLETQSMHSWTSNKSKKSAHSQSAISLNAHYRSKHRNNRNKKQKMKRSNTIQPMQTIQSQSNEKPNNTKKSFTSRWF